MFNPSFRAADKRPYSASGVKTKTRPMTCGYTSGWIRGGAGQSLAGSSDELPSRSRGVKITGTRSGAVSSRLN